MAFILDDILRAPGKLLGRIVKVKKGSRQMMLGSKTMDGSARKGPGAGRSGRSYRTGEDLEWAKTVTIFNNTVLAPLKFVRWVVNRMRQQVDMEIRNESESTDRSASETRTRSTAQRRRCLASSNRR